MNEPGSRPWRTRLRQRALLIGNLVGLLLSVFFFWLAFRNADLDEVWSGLTEADGSYIAFAVGAIAFLYAGQAARWRAIARTPGVTTARFGEMVVSGSRKTAADESAQNA